MRRNGWKAWVLLFGVGQLACSRCGKQPVAPTDIARHMPQQAEAVLMAPSLGALGQRIVLLERLKVASFAAQLQGFGGASDYTAALMGQLGVDLRSPDELAKAGIEPVRGCAVALLPGGLAYAVVGVKDPAKLTAFAATVAKNRLGASAKSERVGKGVAIVTFAEKSEGPAVLGLAVKDGWAWIAAEQGVAQLEAWAGLPAEKSLAVDQGLAKALGRLSSTRDAILYLPPTSTLGGSYLPGGTTVVMAMAATGIEAHADLPLKQAPAALAALKRAQADELFGHLPEDAFLVARFAGEPAALEPFWKRLAGPHVERAFVEAGFDFKTEILDNMKPGAAMALSLSPEVKLGAGMPALDVRRTNPFRYVHFTAVARAKDPARAAATLERLAPIGPRFGAKIEAAQSEGKKVYLTQYSQGEGVHFAAAGDKVVLAAPQGRLDQMLKLADQPGGGPLADAALRALFAEKTAGVAIDLHRLADSVRDLPADAWGIGGFAIKASTVRWLDATRDLRAILAWVDVKGDALQISLVLRLAPEATGVAK